MRLRKAAFTFSAFPSDCALGPPPTLPMPPALSTSTIPNPWVLSLSQHLCASSTLESHKFHIASVSCIRISAREQPPKIRLAPGPQGLRSRHMGSDSALVEQADFLTLQGTV